LAEARTDVQRLRTEAVMQRFASPTLGPLGASSTAERDDAPPSPPLRALLAAAGLPPTADARFSLAPDDLLESSSASSTPASPAGRTQLPAAADSSAAAAAAAAALLAAQTEVNSLREQLRAAAAAHTAELNAQAAAFGATLADVERQRARAEDEAAAEARAKQEVGHSSRASIFYLFISSIFLELIPNIFSSS
jgi:hypothetical protein